MHAIVFWKMHCIVLHNIVNIFLKECIWEPFPAALPLLSDLRNWRTTYYRGGQVSKLFQRKTMGRAGNGVRLVFDTKVAQPLLPKSAGSPVPIDKQTMAQAGIVLKVHCVRKQWVQGVFQPWNTTHCPVMTKPQTEVTEVLVLSTNLKPTWWAFSGRLQKTNITSLSWLCAHNVSMKWF